jgi:hypothetical protein
MARPDALWPHVHLLTVLAQTGSFTQAAQRLALSKAAVSQRISELERAVGVPLVQRTTRSVRLTDAGRQLPETSGASSRSRRAWAAFATWPVSRAGWPPHGPGRPGAAAGIRWKASSALPGSASSWVVGSR